MTTKNRLLDPGTGTIEKFVFDDDWGEVLDVADEDAAYSPTHAPSAVGSIVMPDDHSAGLMRGLTDFTVPTDITITSLAGRITCRSLQDFAMPDIELWWASMPTEDTPDAIWGTPLLSRIVTVSPGVCNPFKIFTFPPIGWSQYFRPNSDGQCRSSRN